MTTLEDLSTKETPMIPRVTPPPACSVYLNDFSDYKTEFIVHGDTERTCFVYLKDYANIPVLGRGVSIRLVIPYSGTLSPRQYTESIDTIVAGLQTALEKEPYPWKVPSWDSFKSLWRFIEVDDMEGERGGGDSLVFLCPGGVRGENNLNYRVAIMITPQKGNDIIPKVWIVSLIEMLKMRKGHLANRIQRLRDLPY